MIIEIKDLPHGRKVKHINVDITFEEDGEVQVQTKVEDIKISKPTKIAPAPVAESNDTDAVIERPVIPEEREKKEVPQEMTDMEF
jgi:hypothetical protein